MECQRCGDCCRQFSVVVSGKIVETHYGEPKVRVMIKHTCRHLKDGNVCEIYDKRPDPCRAYECEKVKEEL